MNSRFNAIITEEERKGIEEAVGAINFRLLIGCIVCDQLPTIIDQRFPNA